MAPVCSPSGAARTAFSLEFRDGVLLSRSSFLDFSTARRGQSGSRPSRFSLAVRNGKGGQPSRRFTRT
jgi:hypothetical protein